MYNIDITSDIHTVFIKSNYKDLFWNNWVLTQWLNSKYLIIVWDINEDISEIENTLKHIIENTKYKKVIITFWNHDIWYRPQINRNDEHLPYNNSIEKYNYLIEYFHGFKNKVHVIDKEDYIIEDKKIIITWGMWWYNYSIKNEDKDNISKISGVDFDKMKLFGFSSADKFNIKFSENIKNNIEFASLLENELIERLKNIKNNSEYKDFKILALSHVKPHYSLEANSQYYIEVPEKKWIEILNSKNISNYSDILSKVYGNAFYTNSNLHGIYKKFNVNACVYWHTHHKYKKNIEWIKYVTNSFGYYLREVNNSIITL